MADAVDTAPAAPVAGPELGTNVPKMGKQTPVDNKKIAKSFKQRAENDEKGRRKYHAEWKRNIELRLGRVGGSFLTEAVSGVSIEDELKSEINPDWSLTKVKTANLYSQVPEVQLTHENKQYAAAIPPFRKALNYELGEKRARVGVCMEEALNDVVNAAGVAAVIVGYDALFQDVEVPAVDEMQAQQLLMLGMDVPMTMAPQLVDDKFFARRLSPGKLLWPSEFVGSDFDDGDYVGFKDATSWSQAKNRWKLKDDVKDDVLGGAEVDAEDDLRSDPEKGALQSLSAVKYTELYYWRHRVDPNEKSFKTIWKLVFVEGIEEPVVHEPWKGQQMVSPGKYIGACKFPIRFLTLTYVTDNPIPPSDSAAGRPQVMDLRRSRQQMFENRDRSRPIRGFDVNRVDDPIVMEQLIKGTWQGIIPFNGNAQNSIWEVARASYPAEDFAFDQATKADLMEVWQVGPNQLGNIPSGEKATKAEVETTQGNFNTRINQERARVGRFFLSIAEVMAGLMALYSSFPTLTDQEKQQMFQAWDNKSILHDLVFKIRPDSTVMLDSQSRIDRLMQYINLTAKSGFVNVMPALVEITELAGLDPAECIKQPEPAPPDQPKISFSFDKDALMNPLVLAILTKAGMAPSPQEIEAAKQSLAAAGMIPPEGTPPPAPTGPPQEGPPPAGEAEASPGWEAAPKVLKRSRDI